MAIIRGSAQFGCSFALEGMLAARQAGGETRPACHPRSVGPQKNRPYPSVTKGSRAVMAGVLRSDPSG